MPCTRSETLVLTTSADVLSPLSKFPAFAQREVDKPQAQKAKTKPKTKTKTKTTIPQDRLHQTKLALVLSTSHQPADREPELTPGISSIVFLKFETLPALTTSPSFNFPDRSTPTPLEPPIPISGLPPRLGGFSEKGVVQVEEEVEAPEFRLDILAAGSRKGEECLEGTSRLSEEILLLLPLFSTWESSDKGGETSLSFPPVLPFPLFVRCILEKYQYFFFPPPVCAPNCSSRRFSHASRYRS